MVPKVPWVEQQSCRSYITECLVFVSRRVGTGRVVILLGEDPLDRRAREGLLIAAADTRDVVQLEQAWQQVCACLGGEGDAEARSLYEQLRREVNGVGPPSVRRRGSVAVAARDPRSMNGESG
jgi:hypothetical protein